MSDRFLCTFISVGILHYILSQIIVRLLRHTCVYMLPCNKELLLMKDSALVRQGLEAEEERQVGNR